MNVRQANLIKKNSALSVYKTIEELAFNHSCTIDEFLVAIQKIGVSQQISEEVLYEKTRTSWLQEKAINQQRDKTNQFLSTI